MLREALPWIDKDKTVETRERADREREIGVNCERKRIEEKKVVRPEVDSESSLCTWCIVKFPESMTCGTSESELLTFMWPTIYLGVHCPASRK